MSTPTNQSKSKATTRTRRVRAFSPGDAVSFAILTILSGTSDESTVVNLISDRISAEQIGSVFAPDVIKQMSHEIYLTAVAKIESDAALASNISSLESDKDAFDPINTLIFNNAASLYSNLVKYYAPTSLFTEQNRAFSLLVAFIAYALACYHPSGWIKYDKKQIFSLAKINKLSSPEQEALTQQLHNDFGLNMRVIGSNQPIPCYNIPWLVPPPNNSGVTKLGTQYIATSILEKVRFLVDSLKNATSDLSDLT